MAIVKKTWNCINELLGRKGKNSISLMDENGENISNADLPNYVNRYFMNSVSQLTSVFNNITVDRPFFGTLKYINNSCYLFPTNFDEVHNFLKKLPNKGLSLLEIKPMLLNKIYLYIIPVIVYIFNLSVACGVYPDGLKVGRVVPVFKSGNSNDIKNYRPITNLLAFNKIFENLVYERIHEFVEKHSIISINQFGFRRNTCTTHAILKLVNDLLTSFKNSFYTVALFLDLRKAFDLVDTNILIEKLYVYGFRGIAGEFLKSYLTNRHQYSFLNFLNLISHWYLMASPKDLFLGLCYLIFLLMI